SGPLPPRFSTFPPAFFLPVKVFYTKPGVQKVVDDVAVVDGYTTGFLSQAGAEDGGGDAGGDQRHREKRPVEQGLFHPGQIIKTFQGDGANEIYPSPAEAAGGSRRQPPHQNGGFVTKEPVEAVVIMEMPVDGGVGQPVGFNLEIREALLQQ